MIDPKLFYLMLYILLALLVLVPIGIILVIFLITAIKMWRKEASIRAAAAQAYAEAHGPDGKPYPPSCRGLCEHCSQYDARIFHIQDGPKLCATCYAKHIAKEPPEIPPIQNEQPTS